jgi:hypothetical protein
MVLRRPRPSCRTQAHFICSGPARARNSPRLSCQNSGQPTAGASAGFCSVEASAKAVWASVHFSVLRVCRSVGPDLLVEQVRGLGGGWPLTAADWSGRHGTNFHTIPPAQQRRGPPACLESIYSRPIRLRSWLHRRLHGRWGHHNALPTPERLPMMETNKRLGRRSLHTVVVGLLVGTAGCNASVPYLEEAEVLAACRQSRIEVAHRIETDEIFIESHYLDYLAGLPNERGHVQHPDLHRIVRYVLEKRFVALETDLGSQLPPSGPLHGQLTRISVQPANSPACNAYRYPWWEMPQLRRLGLDPDHCVALEKLEAPTARVRVVTRPTQVFRIVADRREWFGLWRLDALAGAVDAGDQMQPAIRVIDHVARFAGGGKGYSGWAWGCPDGGVRAQALDAAIAGKGNPMLRRPEVVVVPSPDPAIAETPASDGDIAQLRWLERERCAGGGNTYDAAGAVWIQDLLVGDTLRRALHVLRGDRLLVGPMPLPFPRGVYNDHSVLHFKGGFAVNLTREFKNDERRRLVVFDANLRHVATWTLTAEQRAALVPTDPATINRCTDSAVDQLQRPGMAPDAGQRR